jgi:homoserine kinase type II
MAVYTDVSDEALEAFLEDYDIGDLVACKGIAEGVENSNFLMQTSKAPFILTLYEKRVSEKDLPFFLGLMQHLSQQNITCPTPIAQRSGKVLGALCGRPAAITSFLQGMSVRRPTAHHCALVGQALAKLHLAASGFKIKRPNALSLQGWQHLAEETIPDADKVAEGLSQDITEEIAFLEKNWPHTLPQGIIHADLFPDNVFFLKDALSGLIDFYFACNDSLAYDVAICLNAWCFEPDNAFNVTKARALLNGYASERPFTSEEFDALPVLARGAALRFLLTRLTDWLNVPEGALVTPKDPSEYCRKLRFHQSVDTAHSYGIEP